MSDTPPEMETLEPTPVRQFSFVWIVPLLVVAIAAWTIYKTYAESGVSIEISFDKAKGIEAGKTEVRYKDVAIGVVESLRLTEDFQGVIATALLNRDAAPYLTEETDFWVVTAEISGTSLRGLSTLLSGAYIEVDWPGTAGPAAREFVGRSEPPLTPPSAGGQHFMLRSIEADSVTVGSPVVYRGVNIGQIERRTLSEDFQSIEYEVFIQAPYDALIADTTRFFDVSGIAVSLTSEGLAVNIASLQTLARGGISFYTPTPFKDQTSPPAANDRPFALFDSRISAEESFFDTDDAQHLLFTAVFEDGLEGLEAGSPVMWQGVRLGTVKDIRLDLSIPEASNQTGVVLDLQPERLGVTSLTDSAAQDELASWIDAGMRLEIASSNLLTGSKRLNLVLLPEVEEAALIVDAKPFPRIPTVRSATLDVPKNLGDIAAALAALPYDELVAAATSLMANASQILGSDAAQALPASLITSVDAVAALSDELQGVARQSESALAGVAPDSPLHTELVQSIRELRDASRAVSALATMLEENPNALLTGRD